MAYRRISISDQEIDANAWFSSLKRCPSLYCHLGHEPTLIADGIKFVLRWLALNLPTGDGRRPDLADGVLS
jgi:hypothetical protein